MLTPEKLNRINELARKQKQGTLTEKEIIEQQQLRKEYLANFRTSFRKRLENIEIEYVDDKVE